MCFVGGGGGGGILPNKYPYLFCKSPPRAMGTIEFECVVVLVLVAVAVAVVFLLKVLLADVEVAAGTGILGAVAAVSSLELEAKEENRIDTSLCCWVFWDCSINMAGKMACSRDNDTLTLGAAVAVVTRLVLRCLLCKYNPLSETRAVQEKLGCKLGSGTALVSTPKDIK